jgi:hypothetical protein
MLIAWAGRASGKSQLAWPRSSISSAISAFLRETFERSGLRETSCPRVTGMTSDPALSRLSLRSLMPASCGLLDADGQRGKIEVGSARGGECAPQLLFGSPAQRLDGPCRREHYPPKRRHHHEGRGGASCNQCAPVHRKLQKPRRL